MDMIKKEYKACLLVLGYIIFGELVYITLLLKTTGKWYFALIAGIVILIIGSIIGYFYVKSEYNAHNKVEAKKEEIELVKDESEVNNEVISSEVVDNTAEENEVSK